jgi:DNA recombination protein RmuC
VRSLTAHFVQMKKGIEITSESYNRAVGTLERQVLSTTRKFQKLGASRGEAVPEIEPLNHPLRSLQAAELLAARPAVEDATSGAEEDSCHLE